MSNAHYVCKAQIPSEYIISVLESPTNRSAFLQPVAKKDTKSHQHSMSNSKKLPPHPMTTATTITYKFVWENCYDEDPKQPTPDSHIVITRLATETNVAATQTDSLSDLDPTTTPPPPSSPKTQTINDAHANGFEYIPCTAILTWRKYIATFHGQFNDHTSKFSDWVLDEEATNQAFLGDWEVGSRLLGISHTPRDGFHGGILSGTPVLDDADRRLLFVWIDSGLKWGIKLYGKVVLEGEEVGGLSKGERERLRLDREGFVGGRKLGL